MARAIPVAGGRSEAATSLTRRVPQPLWELCSPLLLLLPQPRATIVLQEMKSK